MCQFVMIYMNMSFVLLCVGFKELQHVGDCSSPAVFKRNASNYHPHTHEYAKQKGHKSAS